MAAPRRKKGASRAPEDERLDARIVDAALALAEERGWQGVRLVDVAGRLDEPPNRIVLRFRDLNSVADAWFLRALQAMIAPRPDDFAARPAAERIEICVLAWFDALAGHRRVTAQMLQDKMHLPHPHHWVPMIFDLSRTIQWLREAALLPARYGTPRASMEEIGLTLLFLATLAVWCGDDSPDQRRTRRFLRRRLGRADRLLAAIAGRGAPDGRGEAMVREGPVGRGKRPAAGRQRQGQVKKR